MNNAFRNNIWSRTACAFKGRMTNVKSWLFLQSTEKPDCIIGFEMITWFCIISHSMLRYLCPTLLFTLLASIIAAFLCHFVLVALLMSYCVGLQCEGVWFRWRFNEVKRSSFGSMIPLDCVIILMTDILLLTKIMLLFR